MHEELKKLPKEIQARLQKRDMPNWMEPMLATLTGEPFSDPDWIYERKFDGERCLTFKEGDSVRLLSRNQKALNVHYPDLVEAITQNLPEAIVVDGEVVAFEGNVTSFSLLQDRMHIQDPQQARRSGVGVYYYLFDILYLDGYDLTQIPQRKRKSILKSAISYQDRLRYTPHRNQDGEKYFRAACQKGWEGIIAKDANSPYQHKRSRHWLKFKCVQEQEFVIAGFTEPQGKRIGLGALLVGYYDDGRLQYAGKVGTGFDDETLRRMKTMLADMVTDEAPFSADAHVSEKNVHWVKPELVAQVGFEEWTDYGRLRQPRFLGLREDKEPRSVRKEEPQS
jgi:bifunctional non-homologous end joining protein LigD